MSSISTAQLLQRSDVRRRILFVEDDLDLVRSTVLTLRASGYDVTHAVSAADAVAALSSGPFDIFLLDIAIPGGLSGLDLCRALRRRHEFDGVPVVYVTGEAVHDSVRVAAYESGGNAIIRKPFSPVELVAAVRSCLELGKKTRELSWPAARSDLAMIGALADGVSHAVATPLMSIRIAASEVARIADADGDSKSDLAIVSPILTQSGEAIEVVLADLRRIGRTTGRGPVDGQAPAMTIGGVVEIVSTLAAMKLASMEITFSVNIDENASSAHDVFSSIKSPGVVSRIMLALLDDAALSVDQCQDERLIQVGLKWENDGIVVAILSSGGGGESEADWTPPLRDALAMARDVGIILRVAADGSKKMVSFSV